MKLSVPMAKHILAPVGILAPASAVYAGMQERIHGSRTPTLVILNEAKNDIIEIVQALEDSNILLKSVTKTVENETKEQKGVFLRMSLGTLKANLVWNILAWKGILSARYGNKLGKGKLRADYGSETF